MSGLVQTLTLNMMENVEMQLVSGSGVVLKRVRGYMVVMIMDT